jgi:hypothetical protein
MKTCRDLAVRCFLLALTLLFTSFIVGEDSKRKIKSDVCSDSYPASIGTANGKSELVLCPIALQSKVTARFHRLVLSVFIS